MTHREQIAHRDVKFAWNLQIYTFPFAKSGGKKHPETLVEPVLFAGNGSLAKNITSQLLPKCTIRRPVECFKQCLRSTKVYSKHNASCSFSFVYQYFIVGFGNT